MSFLNFEYSYPFLSITIYKLTCFPFFIPKQTHIIHMGGCLLTSCTGMVGILTTGVSTGFSPASAEDANELLHLFSFHCQYFHFSCSLWNYVCRHGHPRHHDFTITINIITIIIVTSFTGYSTNVTILNTLT